MKIRRYLPSDREALLELSRRHGEGHSQADREVVYAIPDPEATGLHPICLVVEDEGTLVASVTGRRQIEAFVSLDPAWGNPRSRWTALKRLYGDAAILGYREGFREVYAGIPEHLRGYGRRLERELGFHKDERMRLILDLEEVLGGRP